MSESLPPKTLRQRLFGNRSSKMFIIVAGIVISIAFVWGWIGMHKIEKVETSHLATAGDAGNNVTGDKTTPEYQRIRDEETARDTAIARKTGGTVTPPIRPMQNYSEKLPSSLDGLDEKGPERANPHPPILPKETAPQQTSTGQQPVYRAQAGLNTQEENALQQERLKLDQAMVQAITKIMPQPPQAAKVVAFKNYQDNSTQTTAGQQSEASKTTSALAMAQSTPSANSKPDSSLKTADAGAASPSKSKFQTPAPGTILYSQLVGRVNSDSPGPVIGEILDGPYTGARLLGTFQTNQSGSGTVISFNTMVVPYKDDNGEDQTSAVPIKAVAVDTSHLGTSMETYVNNHLLLNIGMAFGTSFLQGIGQAVSQSGSYAMMGPYGTNMANPVLTMPGEIMMGVGAGAAQAGSIFQNLYGNKPPTIIVEAGTPFGLLFLGNGN